MQSFDTDVAIRVTVSEVQTSLKIVTGRQRQTAYGPRHTDGVRDPNNTTTSNTLRGKKKHSTKLE
jgi:hypothetical protein